MWITWIVGALAIAGVVIFVNANTKPKITLNPSKPVVGQFFDINLSGFKAGISIQLQTQGYDTNGVSLGRDISYLTIGSNGSYILPLNKASVSGTYSFIATLNGQTIATLTVMVSAGISADYPDPEYFWAAGQAGW